MTTDGRQAADVPVSEGTGPNADIWREAWIARRAIAVKRGKQRPPQGDGSHAAH